MDHDGTRPGDGGIERWVRLAEATGLSRERVESAQEVLPAIPRFACEVRRFDPAAFQVLLESCRHVQYSAFYADEG